MYEAVAALVTVKEDISTLNVVLSPFPNTILGSKKEAVISNEPVANDPDEGGISSKVI